MHVHRSSAAISQVIVSCLQNQQPSKVAYERCSLARFRSDRYESVHCSWKFLLDHFVAWLLVSVHPAFKQVKNLKVLVVCSLRSDLFQFSDDFILIVSRVDSLIVLTVFFGTAFVASLVLVVWLVSAASWFWWLCFVVSDVSYCTRICIFFFRDEYYKQENIFLCSLDRKSENAHYRHIYPSISCLSPYRRLRSPAAKWKIFKSRDPHNTINYWAWN